MVLADPTTHKASNQHSVNLVEHIYDLELVMKYIFSAELILDQSD